MAFPDIRNNVENKELPFAGKVVYISGSIEGVSNTDPNFFWELAQFMIENGAIIPDLHVAGRSKEERRELFTKDNGIDANLEVMENPWRKVEEIDIRQVDESTHLVALTNGASYGVGNEIQRAIDNYEMRGRIIHILCLVHKERLEPLSWMIKGKEKPKYPMFHLGVYETLDDAKALVKEFLETFF